MSGSGQTRIMPHVWREDWGNGKTWHLRNEDRPHFCLTYASLPLIFSPSQTAGNGRSGHASPAETSEFHFIMFISLAQGARGSRPVGRDNAIFLTPTLYGSNKRKKTDNSRGSYREV